MFGIKCKQCKKKFTSDFILVIEEICVYCYYKVNEFYVNGELVTKWEAIERNIMFDKLVKEENKKYGRYRRRRK